MLRGLSIRQPMCLSSRALGFGIQPQERKSIEEHATSNDVMNSCFDQSGLAISVLVVPDLQCMVLKANKRLVGKGQSLKENQNPSNSSRSLQASLDCLISGCGSCFQGVENRRN